MTTYNTIPDSAIDPESPVTTGLMTKLRDNPIAISEGATGAPRINPRALAIGGSQRDGIASNATSVSDPGYYDFTSLTWSASRTLPAVTIIRVDGNAAISAAVNANGLVTPGNKQSLANLFACLQGADGQENVNEGAGGGSVSKGGDAEAAALGGAATAIPTARQRWLAMLRRNGILGGLGGQGNGAPNRKSYGGGIIILIVKGDLDMTGGTLSVNGETASALDAQGGGAAGTLIVVCTGTITGGTYHAKGGDGGDESGGFGGGAGAGGYLALVASAYAGTQTISVAGGTAPHGGASNGDAGISETVTMSEAEINGMINRL